MNPLENRDAERSVLGAILLDARHLTALTVDEHLLPEHFVDPAHATVYRAAIDLQTAGHAIDYLTVAARLRDIGQLDTAGGEHEIEALTSWVPATAHVRDYGRLVRERYQARQLLAAGQQIVADVTTGAAPIDELIDHATSTVASIAQDGRHGRAQHTWTPDQLRSWYFDHLGQPAGEVWGTGFPLLDELLGGGLSRGQQMLVAGFEKVGKSLWLDDVLDRLADHGLRVQLYINEMSKRDRINRFVTRHTGIPERALRRRDLSKDQSREVVAAISELQVGITECQGWTVDEISRHVRRHSWDVFAIDIAHNITKTENGTEGWDRVAQELRNLPQQVNGLMFVTVHLRKANTTSKQLPVPTADDIRDTGMFSKLADQVVFVHREQDKDGHWTDEGVLSMPIIRSGEPGTVPVKFLASRLRFTPTLSVVPMPVVDPDSRIQSQGYAVTEAGF